MTFRGAVPLTGAQGKLHLKRRALKKGVFLAENPPICVNLRQFECQFVKIGEDSRVGNSKCDRPRLERAGGRRQR